MPTYEYECTSCAHTLEAFQSISENPLRRCPACGKKTLCRRIGAGAGIIFRGSGFYATDYRSRDYKEKAKKGKESARPDASGKQAGEEKKNE